MTKSTQYALGVFGLIIVLFFVNQKTQSNLNVSTSEIFEGDSSKIFRFQIINKVHLLINIIMINMCIYISVCVCVMMRLPLSLC